MSMSMWASTSAEESNPAWLATQLGFISPSKPLLRLYLKEYRRQSLVCDYNVHSYPVGNGAFASIFCYGCSSHRESITKPSCSISSSSASPQKLFCGLASPSSMLCEVTINPKTECSVIGESTSVFGEMYVRFIFSIYKNYFTNTLRPFMI